MRTALVSATLLLFVAACSAQPSVTDKLDDLDYHAESATGAGLSEYAGGAHIAYFLVWTVVQDLVAPDNMDASVAEPIRQRTANAFVGTLDWFDGIASTSVLQGEGQAFASSCYESYVDEYGAAFGERGYHEPNWSDFEASRAILDALRKSGCA